MKEWELRGVIIGIALMLFPYSKDTYLGFLIVLICAFPKTF